MSGAVRRMTVGVMGPGRATSQETSNAHKLGKLIASNGWILLNGGMNSGVMDPSSQGAKAANGTVVGISSASHGGDLSRYVDIPVFTGMGSARNNINALSSDVVIACGLGLGTISEIVLASKAGKRVIVVAPHQNIRLLQEFQRGTIDRVDTHKEAIDRIKGMA
eukprot:gb/GECG01000313.1/.p1 GENE.gb/GECG01000313.1/~~gb/GECG01000313.1/.p1  ORF type:complete len:164 (+),score=17.99 gb/GECG01000313.1/:1-492(+)